MEVGIQATLDFLHLEDAIFCAEQVIAGGATTIEIGLLTLKSSGFQSARIIKSKFPNIELIIDLKITNPENGELEIASEVGAKGITVSGAISRDGLDKCKEKAKNLSLLTDRKSVV